MSSPDFLFNWAIKILGRLGYGGAFWFFPIPTHSPPPWKNLLSCNLRKLHYLQKNLLIQYHNSSSLAI